MCGKWGEGDECGGGECGEEFFHGGVGGLLVFVCWSLV